MLEPVGKAASFQEDEAAKTIQRFQRVASQYNAIGRFGRSMDEHTKRISCRSDEDGNQLGVIEAGIPAQKNVEKVFTDASVVGSGLRILAEDEEGAQSIESELDAAQLDKPEKIDRLLLENERAESEINAKLQTVEAVDFKFKELETSVPALLSQPQAEIKKMRRELHKKDLGPLKARRRYLAHFKRMAHELRDVAPMKLITNKQKMRAAVEARKAGLEALGRTCVETIPAVLNEYVKSSVKKRKAAEADLNGARADRDAVTAEFEGVRCPLADEQKEQAKSKVTKYEGYKACLEKGDDEVLEKLKAMSGTLKSLVHLLSPTEKEAFHKELHDLKAACDEDPPTSAGTMSGIAEEARALARTFGPAPPCTPSTPTRPPSMPSTPLTTEQQPKRSWFSKATEVLSWRRI